MKKFLEKKESKILILITVVAGVLRFFRLTRADMVGDPAHYSFRSIGLIDTVMSQLQTTPLHWFFYFPWWSRLSFHDHPPFSFLIQNIFFRIFGINLLAAKLPYVLFGIISVVALYFLVKRLYGKNCAWLASFLLAISSYHVWLSQSGFIEGILIFFIILSLLYWLKAFKDNKFFFYWAIFFALAILTKYLALALIPFFFFWLILNKGHWQIFKNKKFYLSILLFFIIISPLIVYNLMMYKTRGHFDMQFSFLFSQEHEDWTGIKEREVGGDYLGNFKTIGATLYAALPLPIYILFGLSFLYILFEFIFKKKKRHHLILLVTLFFLIFFILISASDRWLSIYLPFIYLAIAYFLYQLRNTFQVNKYLYVLVLVILSTYLIFFTINTNHTYQSFGPAKLFHSDTRLENWGFNQLDEWLKSHIAKEDLASPREVEILDDIYLFNHLEDIPASVAGKLFIYDHNINWFASMWYFKVKVFYFSIPLISTDDFAELLDLDNAEEVINGLGPEGIYFIKATDYVLGDKYYSSRTAAGLEKQLIDKGLTPVNIISNPIGQEAFRIYYLPGIRRL